MPPGKSPPSSYHYPQDTGKSLSLPRWQFFQKKSEERKRGRKLCRLLAISNVKKNDAGPTNYF